MAEPDHQVGDPLVCLCQGWCVVDPVPGHRDNVPLGLEALDHFCLLRREHLRLYPINATGASHCLSSGATIPSQHDNLHAVLVEYAEGLRRRGFDRVSNTQEASRPVVDRHEQHRLPVTT